MNLQNLRHDIHTSPKHLRQQNQKHSHIPQPEYPQLGPPRRPRPSHLRREIVSLPITVFIIDGSRLVPDQILGSLVRIVMVGLVDRQGGIWVVGINRGIGVRMYRGLTICDFGEQRWRLGQGLW